MNVSISNVNTQLKQLREEIDSLDDHILLLLQKRFEIVAKIGRLKASNNWEIFDGSREEQIIQKINRFSKISSHLQAVYTTLLQESKKLQSPVTTPSHT